MASTSTALQVKKRNGSVVDYERNKIEQVVKFCLVNGCGKPDDIDTAEFAASVAKAVDAHVATIDGPVNVETIQDFITLNLQLRDAEAAKEFRAYREVHTQMREDTNDAITSEDIAKFNEDASNYKTDLERFQQLDKYSRWLEDKKRRETFEESLDRSFGFMRRGVDKQADCDADAMPAFTFTDDDPWAVMRKAMQGGVASTSMRLLQMAGPAADRENLAIYNCSYLGIGRLDDFAELLYLSMQGTGVGFSCESEFVQRLPRVKRQKGDEPFTYVVSDDTEGWCDSVKFGAEKWFEGYDVKFDYSKIRKKNTRLKTKGGRASGPQPLIELHDFMRRIILARQTERLTDLDVHDICCYIGRAGQMGGVRRAAEISISDLKSELMRNAKPAMFYNDPRMQQRTMANNSAAYDGKPDSITFMKEWLQLASSFSGERGIFNRDGAVNHMPERRKKAAGRKHIMWGVNPCGEVILRPNQLCNLSIAICRPEDTEDDLLRKVEIAAVFGTIQSLMTDFHYVNDEWKQNCELERLLGVDLLGAMDCPLLRPDNDDLPNLLERLRDRVIETNKRWAAAFGINESTATTVIKPGGNSSVRWGTGQSLSGWLSEFMIRHVEVDRMSPMALFLKDSGVPYEISYRDPNTYVFKFPLKAPEGAYVQSDLTEDPATGQRKLSRRQTAIEQLEVWKTYKLHWTEHNPSTSIYVADDEWLEVGHWVYKNWDIVGGLAFFPLDPNCYPQAPLYPVTKEEFEKFESEFPSIPWDKFPRYEVVDSTNVAGEVACSAKDGCML